MNSRSGTSLVEVLVALAIFVIGILAVVRMFPSGFATVKHSENATLADRLAQTELERWRSRAANLPSGILPWGPDAAGNGVVLPDLDPDNLTDPLVPPSTPIYPYFSDVNKFRRVHSESTRIPTPVGVSAAIRDDVSTAGIYILGFSPISYNVGTGDTVVVYSGALRRRALPKQLTDLVIKSGGQYAIDYDDYDRDGQKAVLYVRAEATERRYVLHYSYWVESGGQPQLISVLSQTITVPAGNPDLGYQAVDIPDPSNPGGLLRDMPGFIGIDRRSESLHRAFADTTLDSGWTPGMPYEFKVANTAGGMILFNPAGYGAEEVTARGREPLVANIDYTVLDWHIISEERTVPANVSADGYANVKLTLRFLKQKDRTMESDGTPYPGLYVGPTNPPLPNDVLAVDIQDGSVYTQANGLQVLHKDGVVRFPSSLVNHSFRIYYKADGDWALQTSKAYDSYRRSYNMPPGEREFFLNQSNQRIFFRRCYAGHTVALDIDYTYTEGGDVKRATLRGASYQISRQHARANGAEVCWVDPINLGSDSQASLADLHPGSQIRIQNVNGVYGVSLQARAVWREAGRGFMAGRWKQKTLDTYLTRAVE